MIHRVNLTGLLGVILLSTLNPVYAGAEDNMDAYAALQNCLAQAVDLADNGSYERYCMAAYQSAMQSKTEE